jgi:hypothetical protein
VGGGPPQLRSRCTVTATTPDEARRRTEAFVAGLLGRLDLHTGTLAMVTPGTFRPICAVPGWSGFSVAWMTAHGPGHCRTPVGPAVQAFDLHDFNNPANLVEWQS